MLLIFFILSLALSGLILLSGSRSLTKSLSLVFSALLIGITVHAWQNRGGTELTYFTYDSTAVLLLSVLAILTLPTVYHGFIYTREDTVKRYNIYHSEIGRAHV